MIDMPGYGTKENPFDEEDYHLCECGKDIPNDKATCKECDPAYQDYLYEQHKEKRRGDV